MPHFVRRAERAALTALVMLMVIGAAVILLRGTNSASHAAGAKLVAVVNSNS
jgi:hypothetical protein